MSWNTAAKDKVKTVEERVEGILPRTYAAKLKIFLDRFLPFALILLGSLLTVNYLVPVNETVGSYINYANWALVSYFSLRLAMAFRLAESDKRFLREHWLDAVLVIPAFTLLKEFRGLIMLEETWLAEEEAGQALANLPLAAQLSRIIRITRRSFRF